MKLRRFIGKNVRGYMDFDISFRDSVTFLIGINGSGKTTVLKLLSGLLTPSFLDLVQIEFSEIQLFCESTSSKESILIACSKKEEKIVLKYKSSNNAYFEDTIQYASQSFKDLRIEREYINVERINRYLLDFEEYNVVQKIRQLKTPLFLGLNRRVVEIHKFSSFERENVSMSRRRQKLDFMFDSVDEALNDIQNMFFENIRQNARKQGAYSEDFKKRVLQESFKFAKKPERLTIDYKQELVKLPEQKNNLSETISKLGIKDISEQIDSLFAELSATLKILSETASTEKGNISQEYYEALLRWMINSSQLDKVESIIEYGNAYTRNISKLKEPIVRFTNSINLFFKEGEKEIIVDGQGEIKIKITSVNNKVKMNDIFELSSGEKQLIIMLAHLAFYNSSNRSPIFIIDEPELSLHISWQEIFVDALLKASPDTQFIMATHSPAILAKNERKQFCEDLTKSEWV